MGDAINSNFTTEMFNFDNVTDVSATGDNVTTVIVPRSTTSSTISSATVYIIIGIVGMLGNLFVITVIVNAPMLRKRLTNMFILNQSCLDFIVCVFLISTARIDNKVPYSGVAGDIYCKFWQTKLFLWAFMLSSTYNLLALSIERFLEVVYPIWHKIYSSKTKVLLVIAGTWIFGVTYQIIAFIPTSYVKDSKCRLYARWPSILARRVYGVSVVTMRYFIPLVVLSITYGCIAMSLHKRVKQNQIQPHATNTEGNKWKIGRQNTVKTLVIMAVSYILCWSINQIYYFMFNVGYPSDFTSGLYHGSVALVFISSVIYPPIYMVSYKQFRAAAKKLLWKIIGHNSHPVDDLNSIAGGHTVQSTT